MEFIITNATVEDRHTEPKVWNITRGTPMPAKHEELTVTINLQGCGGTRKFSSEEILTIIMHKLEKITPIIPIKDHK
jgi:hypothetical protein